MIYTSCIKHFWATTKVKTVNGEDQIQALVDKKKVIITETSVRSNLHLEDAEGTECLPTAIIFKQLTLMGYENLTQKLTFYKYFFSPKWKFLIHTILQCLSARTTAWNEFSSTMASAIICLATNQNFNFSKYIFDHMVKNLEDGVKFLMFPRFVQVFLDNQVEGMLKHQEIYVTPSHTKKFFANIKRQGKDFSSKVTPLFETMMVNLKKTWMKIQKYQLILITHSLLLNHLHPINHNRSKSLRSPRKRSLRVLALETTKANQALKIRSLKRNVKKLKKKVSKKTHKLKRLYKIGSSTRVESFEDAGLDNQEDASKQERMIEDLDANEGVALVDETQGRNDQDIFDKSILDDEGVVAKKEVSTADPVPTIGKVVPTAGEVVTTAGIEVSTVVITSQISMDEITLAKALIDIKTSKPKTKGIVIQEPSETSSPIPIDSSQQP
nr:hypothetical protein [Tanacetum cinerariifolium]